MVIISGYSQPLSETKGRRKIAVTESVVKNLKEKDVMICDDCKHNTITYEPYNDGACSCGCHLFEP